MFTIPLIDIAPFLDGTDKKGVASLVDTACRDMGFLMVKGHGVYRELIAGMHRASKAYFARPFWEKMQFKMPADRYRGYTPLGAESLSYSLDEELPADLKESFSMGPFDHAFDDYHFGPGGGSYFAPNVWPDQPDGMRDI